MYYTINTKQKKFMFKNAIVNSR